MPTKEFELKQKTINIKDLCCEAISKWYFIFPIIVVCILISLIYTHYIATPMYDSTAKIYIMNKETDTISTADISISSYLAKDYEELIVDRSVLDEVAKQLNKKISYESLKSSITINNPENTRIIEITVRSNDAKSSKLIADTICKVSQQKIVDILGIDRVNIIREGNVASSPSTPNLRNNVFNGFVIGVLISSILILSLYIMDDKIKGPDDVKKYLDLSVLGVIPFNQDRVK